MAVKHHPDKFNQLVEEQQIAAKKKFQKIQEAYQHLKKERAIK
jgi:DnaJ like chaperone protein